MNLQKPINGKQCYKSLSKCAWCRCCCPTGKQAGLHKNLKRLRPCSFANSVTTYHPNIIIIKYQSPMLTSPALRVTLQHLTSALQHQLYHQKYHQSRFTVVVNLSNGHDHQCHRHGSPWEPGSGSPAFFPLGRMPRALATTTNSWSWESVTASAGSTVRMVQTGWWVDGWGWLILMMIDDLEWSWFLGRDNGWTCLRIAGKIAENDHDWWLVTAAVDKDNGWGWDDHVWDQPCLGPRQTGATTWNRCPVTNQHRPWESTWFTMVQPFEIMKQHGLRY